MNWSAFDTWNEALAESIFSDEVAGQPVHFDVSDERLAALTSIDGSAGQHRLDDLVRTVRSTLQFGSGPSHVLRGYWPRFDAWWSSDRLSPPPVLPLLAILTRTALNMQSSGELSAANFYGRLGELLLLNPSETEEFQGAYGRPIDGRPASAWLWDSLNLWLEMWEGNRGLPTAFATNSHVHIGMPISQALVRQLDRKKFPTVFAAFGLAPRSSVDVLEMVELLGEWFQSEDCSASATLRRLWDSDDGTKERIAEVACSLLAVWDGSGVRDGNLPRFERRLMGAVKIGLTSRVFPSKRYSLSLLINQGADLGASASFLDAESRHDQQVDLVHVAPGWMSVSANSEIDFGSLLLTSLKLKVDERPEPLEREPRRLIPLTKDELLMSYVEVPRVSLGLDFILLCQESLKVQTLELLNLVARPGFAVDEAAIGIPAGWVLIQGVQILSSIPEDEMKHRRFELSILQPIATSQATLEGGFRLPGNTVKYATSSPPELRVTRDGASLIRASITCTRALTNPKPVDVSIESGQPVLIWELAALDLGDGDYLITISDDSKAPETHRTLRLRSADNPAISGRSHNSGFGRFAGSAELALTATDAPGETFTVAPELSIDAHHGDGQESFVPDWYHVRQAPDLARDRKAPITFTPPDPKSCIVTGGHVMQVESLRKGEQYMGGTCKSCGLQRRYPLRPRARRATRRKGKALAPTIDVRQLVSTRPVASPSFDEAFDALGHLRHGSRRELATIARQVESSSLFVDTMIRNLEMLGHLEVVRNLQTLEVEAWSINPTTLAQRGDGKFLVVGLRSEATKVALDDACYATGVALSTKDVAFSPQKWLLQTVDPEVATEIAHLMSASLKRTVDIRLDAAMALSEQLPPLRALLPILPKIHQVNARSIEQWDLRSARFIPASGYSSAGLFRLESFRRTYALRRHSDLESDVSTLVDARLGKYLDASLNEQSILGYDEEASVLYAPLGAELPMLYSRVAALAFGEPPQEDYQQSLVAYQGITPSLAKRLFTLLN